MNKNSKKAKQLYLECDGTNPEVNTLMPFHYKGFQGKHIQFTMIAGIMINRYASEEYKNDWIPYNKDNFHIGKWDKEGWNNMKSEVYKMEKKGLVETKLEDNQTYIRLTVDELFNSNIYKTK